MSEACVELVKQYAHGTALNEIEYLGQNGSVQHSDSARGRRDESSQQSRLSAKVSGIATCILKGQGNLEYYPEELKECRTPRDIDVWVKPPSSSPCLGGERGIPIAVADLDPSTGSGQAPVEVETHFRPLFLDSPLRNHRLQNWFQINEQFGVHDAKIGDCVIPTPTVSFNAVYQLCHIYRHLFDEGICLRQLLDYYFVLRTLHIEQGELADRGATKFTHWCQTPLCKNATHQGVRPSDDTGFTQSIGQWAEGMGIAVASNEEVMHTLSRFGMKKFAAAVMYVLQTVFAMPDEYLICEPNEKEGKFLLGEIMMAGSFGKYDERIDRGSKSFMGFKVPGSMVHAIEKTKYNLRLLTHYPEEVLREPFFRIYHWVWRKLELWRF